MDEAAVTADVRAFVQRYRTELDRLVFQQTQLLEVAAVVLSVDHYRRAGWRVTPANLVDGDFRVKVSTKGYPQNFSWFQVGGAVGEFEIHQNLEVRGDQYKLDGARYVVDVGVVKSGAVSTLANSRRAPGLDNRSLVSFMEVKKLVVYPMLLAQFIGIVHEVKPVFLRRWPPGFRAAGHFPPFLVSTGYLQGTSRGIVDAFPQRGFRIGVLTDADNALRRVMSNFGPPPLAREVERLHGLAP